MPVITHKRASFLMLSRITYGGACLFRNTSVLLTFQISHEVSKVRDAKTLRFGREPSIMKDHQDLIFRSPHCEV
jgi:hypothetical protein